MSSKRPEYLDELNEPLRRAAEAVRAAESPAAAERRAVERARRAVRARSAARPRFRRDLLAIAGIAASIFLGIALWNSYQGDAPEWSRSKPPDNGPVAITTPKATPPRDADNGV